MLGEYPHTKYESLVMLCCKLCATQCIVNQVTLFMIGSASNDKTLINDMCVCWYIAYCECV